MPDYWAAITTKSILQLRDPENRHLEPISLTTNVTETNASVMLMVSTEYGHVAVYSDAAGENPVCWPGHAWTGYVADLPKNWWIEGTKTSFNVNDVTLTPTIEPTTGTITGTKWVTVFEPYIDAYYNIATETPEDADEHLLYRLVGQYNVPYRLPLAGVMLRLELEVNPAAVSGSLDDASIEWTTSSGSGFYD